MTSSGHYQAMYRTLTAQRARARRVAHLRALLAPYTLRAPVIPAQRRRSVQRERIGA